MNEFKVQILRAKMLAKRSITRAVETPIRAGLKFADAVRISLIFAGA